MRIADLGSEDAELLREAFNAAVEGPFFPDWEFEAIMGFERTDLRRLIEEWPAVSDSELFDMAAINVLNNFLGYPHRKWEQWSEYSRADPKRLADLLRRWRGDDQLDLSGRGYFDRAK